MPLAARVSLKIYDVLGREIAVLVNEERPAGTHTVTWNAENAASGMYFYKIEVSGEEGVRWGETTKMVLLR